ncbi:MAG: NAD(P)H-hydrate dehydratase, partial [Clostridia bacterium]|nr:NAD(P)H-hydrate dehydratase [Clostridia bacterium]
DAFERDNFQNKLCVAIDVPSGLCGDGNIAADGTFVADVTVTFEILKKCHLQCPEYCGEIVVKDIGLSPKALSEIAFCAEILEAVQLPKTNPKSHKGSVGTLFSVVGSKLYQGAAALSVNASLRCGCGINMAFVPNSIYTPMACKTSSAIIMPCPENESGQLSFEMIDIISKQIYKRKPTAILAGSGMGLGDDTNAIIDFVLNAEIPCVIDGDGLRSLCLEQLKCRTYETVLTPHIGEFAAICGCSVSEVVEKRFELAHDFAYAYKTVLVLKDYITLISLPDGRQFVLNAPNPGLAKGGSGDVLAGMIASFLSQGFDAELSAKAGVWYHSAAGKWTAECLGERYMLPEDLISSLSKVL